MPFENRDFSSHFLCRYTGQNTQSKIEIIKLDPEKLDFCQKIYFFIAQKQLGLFGDFPPQ